MAKDPAFLFYTQDFQTGTQFFTDAQVGQYVRLMCAQHQHGHLSEQQVLSICSTLDKQVLSKFKKDEQGNYYNERLETEITKRKKFTESRRENAKNGKKKEAASAEHMLQHMENENENSISSIKGNKVNTSISVLNHKATLEIDKLLYEKVAMAWGINKNQYKALVTDFDVLLTAQSKEHIEYGDYKSHFFNWAVKKYPEYLKTVDEKVIIMSNGHPYKKPQGNFI